LEVVMKHVCRTLKHLFPTLYPVMAEWPPEKWLGLPIAFIWLFGCIVGVADGVLVALGFPGPLD
jgi:hypothetical protein